jgi:hypothetical protein
MLSFMAVMAREAWTDQRLDDLKENVSHRFDEVDRRFDRVEADIREVKAELREFRVETNSRFEAMNVRFDSMQRMMIVGFITLFASIWATVLGAILAVLL